MRRPMNMRVLAAMRVGLIGCRVVASQAVTAARLDCRGDTSPRATRQRFAILLLLGGSNPLGPCGFFLVSPIESGSSG